MTTFEELLKDSVSHAYDIERELGGGGMSRVFVAVDKSLGRKIVIKLLSPELTAGVNRERFRREIQVAAQLQHPHIVPLLSAGEQGEIVYYTMPFIDGESLKNALEKGPLPVRDVIRVLYDVVDALGYAHARGVIHRDIKPANILRSGAHSLVTDFGVAKALNAAMPSQAMTSTGLAIGTPAYMAPEQLAGDPTADHRIDIYAVGLMAYELLSGTSPFAALSPQAVMAALFTVDPKPLHLIRKDVPKRLSAIIMQCLSKNAADRPASAEVLLTGLDTIATSSGEIRTREHKVPAPGNLPPTAVVGSPRFLTPPSVAAQPRVPTPAAVPVPFRLSEPRVVTAPGGVAPAPSYEEEPRSRRGLLLGAIALLLLAGIAAILFFQRGGTKPTVATAQQPKLAAADSALASSSTPTGTANAAVAPPVLTAVDSLAIAEAIRKRIAQATAAKTPGQTPVNADSLKRLVQRQMTDSIARAAAAVAAAAAATAAAAPVAAPAPAVPSDAAPLGRPRLAIAEFRENKEQPALSGLSRAIVDGLRAALDNGDGFRLVDQDSVKGVTARTQTGDEAVKILQPEVVITPFFTGTGDTVKTSISVRDLRRGSNFGIRVVSMKTITGNPQYYQYYVGPLVKLVLKQLDDLAHESTRR